MSAHSINSIPRLKSPNTRPHRDGFCVPPVYMPEEGREALDDAKSEILENNTANGVISNSRNNVLLAAILLGLRQIAPQSAVKFEDALKQHGHEIISAIGSAALLVLFCFSMAQGNDVRRTKTGVNIVRVVKGSKGARRAKEGIA